MNDNCDFGCDDHAKAHAHKTHPDRNMGHEALPDHKRGVAGPAHHTKGSMPSQLNPDHGPHGHK